MPRSSPKRKILVGPMEYLTRSGGILGVSSVVDESLVIKESEREFDERDFECVEEEEPNLEVLRVVEKTSILLAKRVKNGLEYKNRNFLTR